MVWKSSTTQHPRITRKSRPFRASAREQSIGGFGEARFPTGRVQLARTPSTDPLCQFRSLSTCVFTPIEAADIRRVNHREPRGTTRFCSRGARASPTGPGLRYFPLFGARKLTGVSFYPQSSGLVLSWFGGGRQSYRSAPHLWLCAAGNFLVTPRGDKITLHPGVNNFPSTYFQGIYQVDRGAQRELFAVNLKNTSESDLRQPTPIELRDVSSGGGRVSALFSIWPYLLLTSLFLLLVEWFVNPRLLRTRSG